jgi:hypothetical protein
VGGWSGKGGAEAAVRRQPDTRGEQVAIGRAHDSLAPKPLAGRASARYEPVGRTALVGWPCNKTFQTIQSCSDLKYTKSNLPDL